MRFLPSLAIAAAIVPSLATSNFHERADSNDAITSSATFIKGNANGNFTFTISTSEAGDVWFRMACPDRYGWMAVGTGTKMAGSAMFIAYQDGTKENGMTLSGRYGHGEVEPKYDSRINLTEVPAPSHDMHNNGAARGMMYVSGHCMNCTNGAASKINVNSQNQSFIWAVGMPGHFPFTTAKDGPLRFHAVHGTFMMDLTASRGNGTPALGLELLNVKIPTKGGYYEDHESADAIHAFAMVLTFLILIPFAIFALRMMGSVKLHMIFQTFGLVLGLIGLCSGLYVSHYYQRSMHFNTVHQILGIFVVIFLIGQWVIGFLHHRSMTRTNLPLKGGMPIRVHRILGSLVLGAGLSNAALGFRLAVASYVNIIYVPLVLIVLVVLTVSPLVKGMLARRRARTQGANSYPMGPTGAPPPQANADWGHPSPPAATYGAGVQYEVGPYRHGAGSYETRSDVALGGAGEPPAYSLPPVQPKHMV